MIPDEETGEQRTRRIEQKVDAFFQKLFAEEKENGTIVTSWISVIEVSDEDNSKPVWFLSSPGSSIITTMGLLEFGQQLQYIAIRDE